MTRNFTPTELRILEVLSDGKAHPRKELIEAIDELAEKSTLKVHLSNLRKKLLNNGQNVLCTLVNRGICYQHVRLTGNSQD